jgi:hypothetical protein
MSDETVGSALRSETPLVVVQAPAGCGKTFQGSMYASEIAANVEPGRVLILTHTHAACDAFAAKCRGNEAHVDIRTLDSVVVQIASVYHGSLGLPPDTGAWARTERDGYQELARKTFRLLLASPMISNALARRYPVIICDEHQDASDAQNGIVLAMHRGGAHLRVFGDPMQDIYSASKNRAVVEEAANRWNTLRTKADRCESLGTPHRWAPEAEPLGRWILSGRDALMSGGKLDLTASLPAGLSVIRAENILKYPQYRIDSRERRPIDELVHTANPLLVLASQNKTVSALRSGFGRSLPIWEGHGRRNLDGFASVTAKSRGDPVRVAGALIEFIEEVAKGLSRSRFGTMFLREVETGCARRRRGRPEKIQQLARLLLDEPDHKGSAKVLRRLANCARSDAAFKDVEIDYPREYWEAIKIGDFEDPGEGYGEISRRRTFVRPQVPERSISTVHKAKGLESANVLVMPCDINHFPESEQGRRLLYVAISRATRTLTLVVPRNDPSPLLAI